MKYRALVLIALFCAVIVSAVAGTLSGYTAESTLSVDVSPDMDEAWSEPVEQISDTAPGNVQDAVPTATPHESVLEDGQAEVQQDGQDMSPEGTQNEPAPDRDGELQTMSE